MYKRCIQLRIELTGNYIVMYQKNIKSIANFKVYSKTRTKRFIRSEAKSKSFLRTELYINKNEKEKN